MSKEIIVILVSIVIALFIISQSIGDYKQFKREYKEATSNIDKHGQRMAIRCYGISVRGNIILVIITVIAIAVLYKNI